MAYEEYIGRRVKNDFEDIAEPILRKGGAKFDCIEDYEIPVIMLRKDFDEGDETFEVWCYLIISLEDGIITHIEYDDRVYGGEALGDINPEEVYTSKEQDRIDRTANKLLEAITEEIDDEASDEEE